VNGDDVRVREASRDAPLPHEAGDDRVFLHELAVQDLHRHVPFDARLPCAVDPAHRTDTD
jgi:hypothetical protein